jgi:hypothetical protein
MQKVTQKETQMEMQREILKEKHSVKHLGSLRDYQMDFHWDCQMVLH